MIDIAIIGTNGEEFAYGACPSAMTFFEQAEMVQGFVKLRFAGRAAVSYRNLEDGMDPEFAERVRRGELELPLVLFDGEVRFAGDIPWQDIQKELKQAIGA
jgi:disulfide oxidoreductase YuzD